MHLTPDLLAALARVADSPAAREALAAPYLAVLAAAVLAAAPASALAPGADPDRDLRSALSAWGFRAENALADVGYRAIEEALIRKVADAFFRVEHDGDGDTAAAELDRAFAAWVKATD